MKLLKLVTLSVFTALVLASVHAENNRTIRIHVPFPFIAGSKALPAGEYIVQQTSDSGLVMVYGRGEAHSAALMTRLADAKPTDEPGARFTSIDGQKYLDQIELADGTARAVLPRLPK
jgi:hypothetical protein